LLTNTATFEDLRRVRDELEAKAAAALREDRMGDHIAYGHAYHRLASMPGVGYRPEHTTGRS